MKKGDQIQLAQPLPNQEAALDKLQDVLDELRIYMPAALALAAADAAPDASAVSLQVVADELAAVAEQARRDLGEEAFAAACDEGARLPRSDVVDLALAAIAAALAQ